MSGVIGETTPPEPEDKELPIKDLDDPYRCLCGNLIHRVASGTWNPNEKMLVYCCNYCGTLRLQVDQGNGPITFMGELLLRHLGGRLKKTLQEFSKRSKGLYEVMEKQFPDYPRIPHATIVARVLRWGLFMKFQIKRSAEE